MSLNDMTVPVREVGTKRLSTEPPELVSKCLTDGLNEDRRGGNLTGCPVSTSPAGLSRRDIFDCDVRLKSLKRLLTRVSESKDEALLRLCLMGWAVVKTRGVAVLDRQTDTCVHMVDRRERSVMSLSFSNWFRLLDDVRMGKAARRIRTDEERIKDLSASLKHEARKSEFLLELFNNLLNHTESKSALSRSFYHWLVRSKQMGMKPRKSLLPPPPSSYAQTSQVASRRTSEAKTAQERLFEAPPWPTPLDIFPVPIRPPVVTPQYERPVEDEFPKFVPPADSTPVQEEKKSKKAVPPVKPPKLPPSKLKKLKSQKSSLELYEVHNSSLEPPKQDESSLELPKQDESSLELVPENVQKPSSASDPSPPSTPTLRKMRTQKSVLMEEPPKKALAKPPVRSPSSSSSSSSGSSSSSSSSSDSSSGSINAPAPVFKLSLCFFMRMRRVVRNWAERAREKVRMKHIQDNLDKMVQSAVSAWRPPGVPLDIEMSVAEAMRTFKEGALMMKRKGDVKKIDVQDKWFQFGPLNDQERFFVGQIESYDRFLLYYGSVKEMMNGTEPRGFFSLEQLKAARYSWKYREFGVITNVNDSDVMKKVSKIPEQFFNAIIICIRYAIGAQVRKNANASTLQGSSIPKTYRPSAS